MMTADINECNIGNSCDQNCVNQNGSYSCSCKDGWGCVQKCINTDGSHECACDDGYEMISGENTCVG